MPMALKPKKNGFPGQPYVSNIIRNISSSYLIQLTCIFYVYKASNDSLQVCPTEEFVSLKFDAETDFATDVELRLSNEAPIRGHKIATGNVCTRFVTDHKPGLHRFKVVCKQGQPKILSGTTYLTFQAASHTSLRVANVHFN